MPANCPHCSVEITALTGFVTNEKLGERLLSLGTAKQAEIDMLSTKLTESQTKAQGYDAIVSERDGYKTKIDGMERQSERLTALAAQGISAAALADIEIMFNSDAAGADVPPEFGPWLETQKERPTLAHLFGEPVAAEAAAAAAALPAATPIPNTVEGTKPIASPTQGWSAEDTLRLRNSPEYQALSREDKRKRMVEADARYRQTVSAPR